MRRLSKASELWRMSENTQSLANVAPNLEHVAQNGGGGVGRLSRVKGRWTAGCGGPPVPVLTAKTFDVNIFDHQKTKRTG